MFSLTSNTLHYVEIRELVLASEEVRTCMFMLMCTIFKEGSEHVYAFKEKYSKLFPSKN